MNVAFERKFVTVANKRLGLPGGPLLHAVRLRRILSSPLDWTHRQTIARRICSNSEHADLIDKKEGYHIFGPDDLPGLMDAVQAANAVYERKYLDADRSIAGADRSATTKPFFLNLLEPCDLDLHPEILAFAKSRPVIDAVTGYLGTVPKLRSMGVVYSPTNELLANSQKYHVDPHDFYQVKFFINVHEVGPENGPFTFIPADKTWKICRKLGRRGLGGPKRLDDNDVQSQCGPEDEISLVGGPGTAAMVDTSNCLHYGSRTRVGHRLVIVLVYLRCPDATLGEKKKGRARTWEMLRLNDDCLDVAAGGYNLDHSR